MDKQGQGETMEAAEEVATVVDPRCVPGSLVEVEPRSCDGLSGMWLVLGPSRDGRDLRVARPLKPFEALDAIWLPLDAFVPLGRSALALAPHRVAVLLICWFGFATWAGRHAEPER